MTLPLPQPLYFTLAKSQSQRQIPAQSKIRMHSQVPSRNNSRHGRITAVAVKDTQGIPGHTDEASCPKNMVIGLALLYPMIPPKLHFDKRGRQRSGPEHIYRDKTRNGSNSCRQQSGLV